ncbi:MAG: hypothetical protein KatS3mg022_3291 [Armatimonadota bacterium]|nr:MAG: hypothetical protein KatS3mg022_3291 [Armatimonadota bacterium]
MWLTLAVAVVSVVFLWREARAMRRGLSSRRQFMLRCIGCALLLALALVLQFKEAIYLPSGEASGGARLLHLLQFSVGVFVLVMALVLVALLDARESLQRYLREHRQMMDELIRKPPAPVAPSSDGKRDENPS